MVQHNNKLYQKDDFVRALYNAAGLTVEGVLERLDEAEKQEFFDTMTETGVQLIEGYLGIVPPKDADIAERRPVEGVLERLDEAEKQEFFDTMTETGVQLIEGYLGIVPPKDADIAERRQNVQSNWLAAKGKKFTIEMIQDVAEAWDNGAVDVQFIGGKIIISFTQIFGVPKYIESITATIEKIKPAHIGFEFGLYMGMGAGENMGRDKGGKLG